MAITTPGIIGALLTALSLHPNDIFIQGISKFAFKGEIFAICCVSRDQAIIKITMNSVLMYLLCLVIIIIPATARPPLPRQEEPVLRFPRDQMAAEDSSYSVAPVRLHV